jgi:hypothetical protein
MTGTVRPTWRALTAARIHRERLLALPGVVAVGAGTRVAAGIDTGEVGVIAFVVEKRAPSALPRSAFVPRYLAVPGGLVATDVIEVGLLTAPPMHAASAPVAPDTSLLRTFSRPAVGGASAAHWRFPTGTLTLGVADANSSDLRLALSCSHVFGLLTAAQYGDPIVAPAPADEGSLLTTLGRYLRSAPLYLDGQRWSRADASAAWCRPDTCEAAVAGLGAAAGVRCPDDISLHEPVWKVGRTTGLTEGHIIAVGAQVRVDYSSLGFTGATALLSDVIMTSPMCAYGDSGSLLMDADERAVGLLFGGTTAVTLYNAMPGVLADLRLRLATEPPVTGNHTTSAGLSP